MRHTTKGVFLLSAALVASGAQAAPNLIVDGGFESPLVTGSPGYVTYANGSTFSNWEVTNGNVDVVAAGYTGTTPPGVGQWLDLEGSGLPGANVGAISQSFATIIGKLYKLTFTYGSNGSGNTAKVSVGNFSGTLAPPGGLNFTPFSTVFKATGTTSTLQFATFGGGNGDQGGVALDAVSVTATPEPEAWASMVLGLGLAGWVARRRRRQTVAAA
jgi:hypothetical protein